MASNVASADRRGGSFGSFKFTPKCGEAASEQGTADDITHSLSA